MFRDSMSDRFRWRFFRPRVGLAKLGLLSLFLVLPLPIPAIVAATQPDAAVSQRRCVAIELYVDGAHPEAAACQAAVRAAIEKMAGVTLKVYDIARQEDGAKRLEAIAKVYGLGPNPAPTLYGLNQTFSGHVAAEMWERRVRSLVTVEMFVRTGCPHCAEAKSRLPGLRQKYPGLIFAEADAAIDPSARVRFNDLAREQKKGAISFPGFWLCRNLVIGFDGLNTLNRIDSILKKWTVTCPQQPAIANPPAQPPSGSGAMRFSPMMRSLGAIGFSVGFGQALRAVAVRGSPGTGMFWASAAAVLLAADAFDEAATSGDLAAGAEVTGDLPTGDLPTGDLGGEGLPIELPLPDGISDGGGSALPESDPEAIDIPWLGRVSAGRLGMPLFTIAIGLIDGFNPCAMWVLLFLLSVLVNLRDRWKILLVAGTFVLISGIAYFLFMAAWLNVLMWVGLVRWVQVGLAMVAIVVGVVHIKDFFALHRGISLSIPESAKPGIYDRVRRIVMAETFGTAILGAAVLAILVNLIELLCTAGLPALYSQVLSLRNYPAWVNYAYLGLYIVAYMFDDSLMVAAVVLTLGKRKLQEHEGRWLKLVSGSVVLALGLMLLFRPEWLVF